MYLVPHTPLQHLASALDRISSLGPGGASTSQIGPPGVVTVAVTVPRLAGPTVFVSDHSQVMSKPWGEDALPRAKSSE